MQQLRRHYIDGLLAKIATLKAAQDEHRVGLSLEASGLRRAVHAFRISGVIYGFPEISAAAARAEEAMIRASASRIDQTIEELLHLLMRVREAELVDQHRILLVMAEGEFAAALRAALESPHRRVLHEATLEGARAIAQTGTLHCVVVDTLLPDGDGRKLAQELRLGIFLHGKPIILLAEIRESSAEDAALTNEIDIAIMKPCAPRDVARAVIANLSSRGHHPHDPTRDLLTGLLSRRGLIERYEQTLALTHRCQIPTSIAILDVDGLDALNDRQGKDVGDYLLASLAHRLSQNVRKSDLLARWSSGSFVLVMPGSQESDARSACERLLRSVRERGIFHEGTEDGLLSFSMGVAEIDGPLTCEEAVARADWYLFHGKGEGRDPIASKRDLERQPKSRILLHSLDQSLLTTLGEHLVQEGFDVLLRLDAHAALAAAVTGGIDILVIDLAQEGFVALSLIKQMKRSSNLKTTPILLLADSACLNEIHLALAEGANDFLLRPASPHELSARVKQLLRTHRT